MIGEIKSFLQHGRQYIPDLTKATVPTPFRGRPEISAAQVDEEALMACCPTGAIGTQPVSIDMGKCAFCGECAFAFPEKIVFTNDHKIATNDRQRLIIKAGQREAVKLNPAKVRDEIKGVFGRSLKLRQVSAGGDNSCEFELGAAGNPNFDMGRYGIEFVASPRHADGIVITGPITQNMATPLQICYESVPDPKLIVLVGVDAISGGIFADSPALNRGFLSRYPIDLYVPGNPPHPLTFINGVLELTRKKYLRK